MINPTRLQIVIAVLTSLIFFSQGVLAVPPVKENIFPLQSQHCHSSSLVELPNGDLLVCWFQGSGERTADDVQILGARKKTGASEWSEVFPMADTPGFPDCNPILFLDGNQRLHLVWITVLANSWEHSLLKTRMCDSTGYQGDGPPHWQWQDVILLNPGETFPAKVEQGFGLLPNTDEAWAEYAPKYSDMIIEAARDPIKYQTGWMPRIHPAILPSGRILIPLYSDGFNLCLMAISDDQGETWKPSDPLVGVGPIQPTVVRRSDGSLVAFMRDSGDPPNRVLSGVSRDDGISWSPILDTDIPNPGSSLEAVVLSSGDWILVLNDTEQGRHRLSMMLSRDEGKTWSVKKVLEESTEGGDSFAYPSVIQARDGMIHLTYSFSGSTGKSIRHMTLSPDWIQAP